MLKKLLLCLTAVSFSLASFAQSIASIQSPSILPPAPDAASLGKYGQIPVDKSTGIPNISIPLYEIKTPRFTVPISLSYHASGVRVDETSGWVGNGWSLNAGGCISRTIMGIADDLPGGFLNLPIPKAQSLYTNYHVDSLYMEYVIANLNDSQPDNFFYNFAGQSGAFIFSDVTKAPITIPYKPIQITISNSTEIPTFTIIDEQGNAYYFSNRETSSSLATGGLVTATSWYLSKMVSADKSDTVKFYYKADPNNFVFVDNSYSFMQNIGPGANNGEGYLWNLTPTTNSSYSYPIHIDSITYKGGRVDFIAKTGRKDNAAISLDSVIVSNYDYNAKKYTRLKSFKLLTDYFYSSLNNPPAPYNYNTDSASRYRLKLTGLQESDQGNLAVKTHQFTYNATMLPPLHNFGQDLWGYYNGNWNNQTLLQTTQVVQPDIEGDGQNTVYTIASGGLGADRSVSASNMQAGVLTQITYPTQGYTQFTYEPNQYLAPAVTTYTPSANSVGVYQDTSVTSFTPILPGGQTVGQLVFQIQMTKNPQPSFVEILQGGTPIYSLPGSTTGNITTTVPVTVTSGATYQMMAVSYDNIDKAGTSPLPISTIGTTYQVTGAPVPTNVGGLRIKTITNYDSNNAVISSDRYKYGTGETGAGDFLTSTNLMQYESSHIYQFPMGYTPQNAAVITYSNNSVYALSSLSGSPVAYDQVTIYHGDTVNNIGKSIYNYVITPDSILQYQVPIVNVPLIEILNPKTHSYLFWGNPTGYGGTAGGIKPIPRLWQNGEPVSESHYMNAGSGVYSIQQAKTTSYTTQFRTAGRGLYLQFLLEFGNGASRSQFNMYTTVNDFTFYDYPISDGARIPSQTLTTNYTSTGGTTDTVTYYYDNLNHLYPTRIFSYDGKGNTLLKQVLYPQDMVNAGKDPTGIYAAMVSANIISPVIQFTESKNSTQLEQSVTNYSNANPGIIKPLSVSLQTMANPAETRLNYTKYDSQGNLLTVSKTDGVPVSYIWGYKGEYPVAEVKNAAANDIFYEGFEGGTAKGVSGDAKTGNYSYFGTYSKTLTGLDNGIYFLTYWQKNGAVWVYNSSQVTVTGGTYTIAPSAQQVDDIRFYPTSAQMTTYTYNPTVGVTSTTDAKGKIEYYEYDSMQRLMNIRDQNKNITKSISYNYNGQATSGYIDEPSFKSIAEGANFTKTGCGTGYTGPTVNYTVPAGTFTSNISQQDANNQAINEVNTNGQNYANTYGGPCLQNITFTINNPSAATGIQLTFYGSTTSYTYTVPAAGGTISVPSGTYSSLYISPDSRYYPHHYTLGTRTVIYNSSGSFSNVNIAPGSSDLTLTIAN